jgi:hypothetical protein
VLLQSLLLAQAFGRELQRDTTINLFDANYRTTKLELRLWLKANPDSYAANHQENKLKILLKRERIFWENARVQHMCALTKVDALSFWKKYRLRAFVVDKISAVAFLEGFRRLVG